MDMALPVQTYTCLINAILMNAMVTFLVLTIVRMRISTLTVNKATHSLQEQLMATNLKFRNLKCFE